MRSEPLLVVTSHRFLLYSSGALNVSLVKMNAKLLSHS